MKKVWIGLVLVGVITGVWSYARMLSALNEARLSKALLREARGTIAAQKAEIEAYEDRMERIALWRDELLADQSDILANTQEMERDLEKLHAAHRALLEIRTPAPAPAPPAAPVAQEPPARDYAVEAEITTRIDRDGTAVIRIQNTSDWTWEGVRVSLNPGLFGGGYMVQTPRLQPGGVREWPLTAFASRSGERFLPDRLKIQRVDIHAKNPRGHTEVNLWQMR